MLISLGMCSAYIDETEMRGKLIWPAMWKRSRECEILAKNNYYKCKGGVAHRKKEIKYKFAGNVVYLSR